MNAKQQSKYNMYLTTVEFLNANNSITMLLPRYQEFYGTFQNGISQIRSSNEQQSIDKSGIASNKKQLRKLLVKLGADTSRKIQSYAKIENNQILLNEAKFTESDFKNASDSDLETFAQSTYDTAQKQLGNLAQYGVTNETQNDLMRALTDFRAAMPTPRNGAIGTKLSTEQLTKSFTATDKALDNIDALVEIVRISQPEFYSGYKSARKIIDTAAGSLQLKGFVTDAGTGEGLKGATVSFELNNNSNGLLKAKASGGESVKKKTADKGGFNIKSLPEGTYSATVSKNGYADVVTTIAITNGELAVLNVELVKNI
ncbi:hypothetical protein Palpr_1096 [Paludibacter propionicigenes WB4]|uniref:Carboxypeptidase regulatory-like domain-containing protein n=1 Tax=Paludibacter propionicigenes (strain DSM 17365 / JCM 13257 / WB4) TaxID=694427 RepID=E4T3F0_PALPW|nr:carboxypeptidase-like regulatory domain-containing protein [Paludibacter propionicigenes]ADQ79244.1 hypothetical protein Palpr_1096 [Paludibacter propionicigenes WB4]